MSKVASIRIRERIEKLLSMTHRSRQKSIGTLRSKINLAPCPKLGMALAGRATARRRARSDVSNKSNKDAGVMTGSRPKSGEVLSVRRAAQRFCADSRLDNR
jgi:hypothetical protein